jgi:hypothetical protein
MQVCVLQSPRAPSSCLAPADGLGGKSDPYCIVGGVNKLSWGQTRVVRRSSLTTTGVQCRVTISVCVVSGAKRFEPRVRGEIRSEHFGSHAAGWKDGPSVYHREG